MKQFLIICIALLCLSDAAKDYTGYKVYDVLTTKNQLPLLKEWEFQAGIDIWSFGRKDKPSRIMVAPEMESNFLSFLNGNDISYKVAIDNFETIAVSDKIKRVTSRLRKSTSDAPNFELYWNFEEMEAILKRLERTYPNLVKLEVIGKSIEERNIYGIKVSKNKEFGLNPIIFIDAGTHAREWAGIQSAFYFLHQLTDNSTVHDDLLDKVDYVFVPLVNPDGYEYSFTEDRLWRKNRRFVNVTCTGIDLNRNFPYLWRYRPNSCAGTGHPGPFALSEPETRAVASYMESFKGNLRLYLSTHTYGPYVLWPFGFEFDVYIKNHKEHQILGEEFRKAILDATGEDYEVGNSADILYTANGASDDFAVAYANANFAFTLELTGRGHEFDYPQDMIHDLVKETFLGYRAMALYIKKRFNVE